jgi:hypothetical protein
MRSLRTLVCGLALFGALALGAAPALAESPVVVDCVAHNRLTHTYTLAQLQTALNTMPAATKEYSNCYTIIKQQLNDQLSTRVKPATATGPASSSGGSSFPVAIVVVIVLIVLAGGAFAYRASRSRINGS